ncbi:hypothetical protein HME9302_01136 [Alteripontixanthobacter maritimus]|uniref:Copper chaperone PCu(A)C n=1 Tax=Alteripontixanthobacter maritimus TaxID=2161824 RepID=A0A369QAJ2_9SPHN|nr:copper chaperone PCu(A)C [Alteripontixanthobacter maritimus]RDC59939.1 hypothetical protein HME9302_01136 [Alteripontixanthobacter maritimus]
MNKVQLAAGLLGFSALTLSGCGESAPTEEVAPEAVPGLSVTDGRMVLAAVEGNPAAVYFNLAYDGDRGLALNRVAVEGAEDATFHQYGEMDFQVEMMEMSPSPLKKGTKLEFKPGSQHVMATGVSPDLKPGGTTEVTLIVSGGDKLSFPVEILAAGDAR